MKESNLKSKKKEDDQQEEGDIEEEKKEEEKPKEELKDEDFEYKLVGVVIHKGTAEWGHYVSLIDANRGVGDEKWLLFDDGHVSEFKMENFDEECFGSTSGGMKDEYSLYDMTDTFSGASKSAYILVYDKVKKSKLHFEFTEENIREKDFIVQNLIDKEDYRFEDNILETGFYNLGKYIPPSIKEKIDKDNNQFILEQQLYSTSFLSFFSDVIVNSGLPVLMIDFFEGYHNLNLDPFDMEGYKKDSQGAVPSLPKMTSHQMVLVDIFGKVLPKYYFQLFCNSNELYKLQAVEKMLERVFILKPTRAWEFFCLYVRENLNRIFHLIISNTEAIIRSSVAEVVASCLQVVTKFFKINLLKDEEKMSDPEKMIKEVLGKYLNVLTHMENANAYKKLPHYFYLLYRALQKNYKLQDFMIEKQYLNDLYEFYMSKVETKTYSKDAHERALNYLVAILSILLRRIKTKYFNDEKNGKFYRNLFLNLMDGNFFKKLLKEDYYFSNHEFVRHLVFLACENNELISLKVITVCLEGLHSSGTNDILPYLEAIKAMLFIRDKIMQLRIRCIFGVPRLEENKIRIRNKPIFLFGMAKENNILKSVYSYMSPVLKQKSLTQMIVDKHEHFREWVTVVLCVLINVIYNNDSVLFYLLGLPSPNYYSGNCLDWVWKFAKEVDAGNNITYSIMRQEIQYFYLRNFKDKINDFIVYVRNKLKVVNVPEVVLFEEDWQIDCSQYISNGHKFEEPKGEDLRLIDSPILKPMRYKFDRFVDKVSQAKQKEVKKLKTNKREQEKENEDTYDVNETKEVIVERSEDSSDSIKIPMAPPLKEKDSDKPKVMTEKAKEKRLKKFDKVLYSSHHYDMIGRSLGYRNIKKIVLYSIKEQTDSDSENKVINSLELKVDVQKVLTRESLPMGSKGNLNIPKNCIHNKHYLKGNATMKDKSFSQFVRNSSIDDNDLFDNDNIQPYFHDIEEVKPRGKHDYSGIGNDYQVEYEEDKGIVGEGNRDTQHNDNTLNDNPSPVKTKEASNDKPSNDNEEERRDNQVESIIRIGISNRTEQNFLVKFEFNKIEDIDFTKQVLDRGYFDSENRAEITWSDNDAYSEDDTQDDENYFKRVKKNHRQSGNRLFRKQKEIKRVKESLKKNYVIHDTLKGVSVRKKDMPISFIRKRISQEPFGDLVIKVSWTKVEKIGIKSLERNFGKEWDWKLIRLQLTE